MKYAKKILLIILFIFTINIGLQTANACSVGPGYPPSGEENFAQSNLVFVGTVKGVNQESDINGVSAITFDVEKVYKGVPTNQETVEVQTGNNSAMCGYDGVGDIFTIGTIWSIYASTDGYTTSLALNKQYTSVNEAIMEVDSFSGELQVGCIELYDPVCGLVDTGIRCVTEPCPSQEQKTFSNSCYLEREKAVFLHAGECSTKVEQSQQYQPPANCSNWYDGCNWCGRSEPNGPAMCTLRACFQEDVGYCEAYFEVENPNPGTSPQIPTLENPSNPADPVDNSSYQDYQQQNDEQVSVYDVTVGGESDGVFQGVKKIVKTFFSFLANLFN